MNLANEPMLMTMTWEELNAEILAVMDKQLDILIAPLDEDAERRLDALARREASLRSARAKIAIDTGRIAPMPERVARIAERNRRVVA